MKNEKKKEFDNLHSLRTTNAIDLFQAGIELHRAATVQWKNIPKYACLCTNLIDCGANGPLQYHLQHLGIRRFLLHCIHKIFGSYFHIFNSNFNRTENNLQYNQQCCFVFLALFFLLLFLFFDVFPVLI